MTSCAHIVRICQHFLYSAIVSLGHITAWHGRGSQDGELVDSVVSALCVMTGYPMLIHTGTTRTSTSSSDGAEVWRARWCD